MRLSKLADQRYHHRYYMAHRAKYRARQYHWQVTHRAESRKRGRISYRNHHQHNNVNYDVPVQACHNIGMSPTQTASFLNVSKQTVYNHLKKLGLWHKHIHQHKKR